METFLEKYISLADKEEGDATMEEYNFMKPIQKKEEINKFFNKLNKFSIDKVISLDETSIGSALKPAYIRCELLIKL